MCVSRARILATKQLSSAKRISPLLSQKTTWLYLQARSSLTRLKKLHFENKIIKKFITANILKSLCIERIYSR